MSANVAAWRAALDLCVSRCANKGPALAPSARQVPAKPSAKVKIVASPTVHNSGPAETTHSIPISRVTKK